MFVPLKGVQVVNDPAFRIVPGAAPAAARLAVLHHDVIITAAGALVLIMGLVRGVSALAGHAQKGHLR